MQGRQRRTRCAMKWRASDNQGLAVLPLPGQLVAAAEVVKSQGCGRCWCPCRARCRSHCCSRAIVAVLVGMRWLGLRRGQCLCLAAGSLSLRILPAFLGQASPPLLSANAGTAHSRARLRRNLSTPLQGEAPLTSHPSPAGRHHQALRDADATCRTVVAVPACGQWAGQCAGSSSAACFAWVLEVRGGG